MENTSCVSVPHVGEGVRHVMVNKILKQVGDWVDEEANIAEIETDKAILEIPSSTSGYVTRLLCREGERLEIGTPFIELSSTKLSQAIQSGQSRRKDRNSVVAPSSNLILSVEQAMLAQAMTKSITIIPQATIEKVIAWEKIDNLKKYYRSSEKLVPSALAIITLACARAISKYEKFSCSLDANLVLRRSDKLSIGIAKAGENDRLVTPVICLDNICSLLDVHSQLLALGDNTGVHSFTISDMSTFGVTRAVPVVVYPAVATLIIASPYRSGNSKLCNLSLSFDHRLINGVYAAKFLKELDLQIDTLLKEVTCQKH